METLNEEKTIQIANESNLTIYPNVNTAIVSPITCNGLSFQELLCTLKAGIIQSFSPDKF